MTDPNDEDFQWAQILERLEAWKLLESEFTALMVLAIAVVLALADRVAAGLLVTGLFVALMLFRTLPKMTSFKGMGFEAQWIRENVRVSQTGTGEVRADLARERQEVKTISARTDLPADLIPALNRLNSTFEMADEKLTIVQTANTAMEAFLKTGRMPSEQDENKIFSYPYRPPTSNS